MDRFQELSKIALDELSEVFARMSDENVSNTCHNQSPSTMKSPQS